MAVEGEPLQSRSAILKYSVQVTKGTAVAPATAVGIASFDVTSDAGLRDIFTVGSHTALFFKPGFNRVDFNINISHLQSKAFLQQAVRTAGALPYLTLGFGYRDDAGTSYVWQVQDCKIGTIDLVLEAGGPVTLAVGGVGGVITNLSSGSAVNLAETPFLSYEGVSLKGGAAYEARRIRIAVDHHLEVIDVIHGAAPSTFKRGWKYIVEGREEITFEIERWAKSAVSMQADTFTAFTTSLAMTDIIGGMTPNAATIALADAVFGSERLAASDNPDEMITFLTPGRAKTWSVA